MRPSTRRKRYAEFFQIESNLWRQMEALREMLERLIRGERHRLGLTPEQRREYITGTLVNGLPAELRYRALTEEVSLVEDFAEVTRRSFVVLLYTQSEHMLNALCRTVQKAHQNPIAAEDLMGKGIQRAADYVRLVENKNIKNLKHWQDLRAIQFVRNQLAHTNGVIAPGRSPGAELQRLRHLRMLRLACANGRANERVMGIMPGLCKWAVACTAQFFEEVAQLMLA